MLTANTFQDLMGRSPLPSLQHHLMLAVDCSQRVPLLLEAALKADTGLLKALRFKVMDLAQEAQQVQTQLARDWPKGVLLPIRRRDVVLVLESQGAIIDVTRQIAGLLQLPLAFPPEVNSLMLSLGECGVKTCSRALRAIESLETVIRSGLKGPDVSTFYELVDEVRQSNEDAKAIVDDLRSSLHEQCRGGDAVSMVFMLELIRSLGELSRQADVAAGRALLLVSR